MKPAAQERGGPLDFLPCLLLLGAVVGVQCIVNRFSLLVLALSGALGLAIAAAVPKGLVKWCTALVASCFLMGASYVETLDEGRPLHWEPKVKVEHIQLQDASLGLPNDRWVGETFSVVLPCAYEGLYASRTVESVWRHTKKNRLKEIIVVDDGSSPKLELELPEPLQVTAGSGPPALRGASEPAVRLLRHSKTLGLIAAKKTGGDAALGDVIVFFDCHVKPRDGWEEAFLRQMHRAGDHRTMVVPTITALNPDTWEETAGATSQACYMTWNADFTWLMNPGRDVPIMSGGLLGLSKRWWQETGGYDDRMVAWGGENIDQSLRSWLCGGRIEVAEGAFVAHMWRDANNPKTQLKYTMKTEDVMRNKARAVSAWLGPFANKTFTFPEYDEFFNGENSIGDLSNFNELREKLKCADFSSYIQRFSYVYLDGGLVPEKVFQIQEVSTGLCLEREAKETRSHGIVLSPCVGEENKGPIETQLWHPGNRDRSRDGSCCSGLMNWNFLQCLSAGGHGTPAATEECEIGGHNAHQHFRLGPEGLVWRNGLECLAPTTPEPAVDVYNKALSSCRLQVQEVDSGVRLQVQGEALLCVTVDGADPERVTLDLQECDKDGQVFATKTYGDGVQLQLLNTNICLDAGQGEHILPYACYPDDNRNQAWSITNRKLVWDGGYRSKCADMKDKLSLHDLPEHGHLTLAACSNKPGQRIQRHDVHPDGSFLLRDADLGKCLSAKRGKEFETQLSFASCDQSDQRFRELKGRQQVQHIPTGFCFDAGNDNHPIIYPCHEPKAQRKQRFAIVDSPGWVQLMRGWEDNGRKRFFERCLDYRPQPPARAVLKKCADAKEAGVKWRFINTQVSTEWQLWQNAAKPTGLPLGGDVAPP
ncbi:unnamed protein product [Effrenium voratum]|nr:unnamed protein product [Effrenium voratum]